MNITRDTPSERIAENIIDTEMKNLKKNSSIECVDYLCECGRAWWDNGALTIYSDKTEVASALTRLIEHARYDHSIPYGVARRVYETVFMPNYN